MGSPTSYKKRKPGPPHNKQMDIDILNSGNSGLSVVSPSYNNNIEHTTHKDYYTTSQMVYTTPKPRYTSPKHQFQSPTPQSFTTPKQRLNSPYEFYSPKPLRSKDRNKPKIDDQSSSLPAPLPPPGNFPSFFNTKHMKEEKYEKRPDKRKYQAPPPVAPYSPPRPNPLQSLLNPFRNIF